MGAYDRIEVQGHTLNKRTAAVREQYVNIFHLIGGTGDIHLVQGSYNSGAGAVAASAGTHFGGGAADEVPAIETPQNWMLLQKARRICMVAAWDRPTIPDLWEHHDHGIVIGDREMSSAAAKQIQDYHAWLNGLANHAPDRTFHPSVLFAPVYPLPNVDLSNMVREANKVSHNPGSLLNMPGVHQIQHALNLKTGTHLAVDGIYHQLTKAAYARYEKQVGGNGDGIPGVFSLTLLGAGLFNVVP